MDGIMCTIELYRVDEQSKKYIRILYTDRLENIKQLVSSDNIKFLIEELQRELDENSPCCV